MVAFRWWSGVWSKITKAKEKRLPEDHSPYKSHIFPLYNGIGLTTHALTEISHLGNLYDVMRISQNRNRTLKFLKKSEKYFYIYFFRKSKIGFQAFMRTIINLFVKKFQPDLSKTMTSMQLYSDHTCRLPACYLAKRRAFCKICFLVEMFVYLYIFFFVTIFSNFNSLCRSQF